MRRIIIFLFFIIPFISQAKGKTTVVCIETTYGEIFLKLYDDTPVHKDNFIKLVNQGFFNGTYFHRIIKDFMIQGGDPYTKDSTKKDSIGNGGPGYTLAAEILSQYIHKRGVLAAAREGDDINPERRSSGSQFYIVQGKKFTDEDLKKIEKRISMALKKEFAFSEDVKAIYKKVGGTPWLDMQYTVFGEVVKGMEVVDKLASVKTAEQNRPVEKIVIKAKVLTFSSKKYKRKFEQTK